MDNQFIADLVNGRARAEAEVHRETIASIMSGVERLMEAGCLPRMRMLPLVTWRDRSYNTLADRPANQAMDDNTNIRASFGSRFDPTLGDLIQFHSDGGYRSSTGQASAGVSITSLRNSESGLVRTLLYCKGVNLVGCPDSFHAEVGARCLAFRIFLQKWEGNGFVF